MDTQEQKPKITNSKTKVVGIRYIGKKPKKTSESVAPGSGLSWAGFGDVQPVPEGIAHIFLRNEYREIWQHEEKDPPENQSDDALSARAAANATTALAARKAVLDRKTPKEQERAYDIVPKERIVTAIGDLAANPAEAIKHFKPDGTPKLESVQTELGKKISQPALTEAWDELMSGGASR